LRAADAVIRADRPMLKVPDGAVRPRHDGTGALPQRASQRLLEGDVPEARGRLAGESSRPSV
jgi:hypothetical protein